VLKHSTGHRVKAVEFADARFVGPSNHFIGKLRKGAIRIGKVVIQKKSLKSKPFHTLLYYQPAYRIYISLNFQVIWFIPLLFPQILSNALVP